MTIVCSECKCFYEPVNIYQSKCPRCGTYNELCPYCDANKAVWESELNEKHYCDPAWRGNGNEYRGS